MGGRSQRRNSRPLSARGTRSVRLPHRMLLARAGSRSIESCAGLDRQVCGGAKRLAQNRLGISMKFRTPFILLLLSCAVVADDKLPAGNGVLYLGGRPNHIFIIDEATEKVIGDIRLKTGSPGRLNLSQDKKRFYVENLSYEDME